MMGAFLTAVLGFVVVRRHTRTEEDEGRLELLGAGVVGRWSALAAAVTLGTIAVVAASVLSGRGARRAGHGPAGQRRLRGRLADGRAGHGRRLAPSSCSSPPPPAAPPGSGSASSARCSRCGPSPTPPTPAPSSTALGWLSPLGWAGRVEAYGANRTWLLLLGRARPRRSASPSPCAVLDRRDLGAGRASPPATARAAPGGCSSGPFSLVTRLARGTIIGWAVGMVLGGVVVGSLLGSVADMVDDPAIQDLLEKLGGTTGTVENVYLATEIHFVAVAVAAAGIALVLRLVGSERSGLGEVVLATPTSRLRWFGAHVVLPVVLTTALMALLGAVVGLVGPIGQPDRARRSAPRSAPPWPRCPRCG